MDNPEVKTDYERVEVEPTTDEELVEGQEEQTSESSSSDDEQGATEQEAEAEEESKEESPSQPQAPAQHEPQPVAGETPREAALRKELARQRAVNAAMRRQEFSRFAQPERPTPSQRINPDEVLSKYKPEEIQEVETLINAVGAKMGFVRKEDIAQQTYQQQSEAILQDFLDAHPEYKSENDPDNANWNRFREAYKMYRPPADPKAYAKIFQSIHRDIFGIQPTEGLKKTAAQREKVRVASHGQGARQAGRRTEQGAMRQAPTEHLDPSIRQHLKGDFSDIFGDE